MKKLLRCVALLMLAFMCTSSIVYAALGTSSSLKVAAGSGGSLAVNPWGGYGYRFSIIATESGESIQGDTVAKQLDDMYTKYANTYPGNTGENTAKGYYVLEATHNNNVYDMLTGSDYKYIYGTLVGSGARQIQKNCVKFSPKDTWTHKNNPEKFKVDISAESNTLNPLATKKAYEAFKSIDVKETRNIYKWLEASLGSDYIGTCRKVLQDLVDSEDLMKSIKYLDGSMTDNTDVAAYGSYCLLAYVLGATKDSNMRLNAIYDNAWSSGGQPLVIIDSVILAQFCDYKGELSLPTDGAGHAIKSKDSMDGGFYRILSFRDYMNYYFGLDGSKYWMEFYNKSDISKLNNYVSNESYQKNGTSNKYHVGDVGSIFTLATYVHDSLVKEYVTQDNGKALNCDLAQAQYEGLNYNDATRVNYSNTYYQLNGQHQAYSDEGVQMRFVIVKSNDTSKVIHSSNANFARTTLRWFRRSDSVAGAANAFTTIEFTDRSNTKRGHYGFALAGALASPPKEPEIPAQENWIWDDTKTKRLQKVTREVQTETLSNLENIIRVDLSDNSKACKKFEELIKQYEDAGVNAIEFGITVERTTTGGSNEKKDIVWQYNNKSTELKRSGETHRYKSYYKEAISKLYTNKYMDENSFYIRDKFSAAMTDSSYVMNYTPKLTITLYKDASILVSDTCEVLDYETVTFTYKYKLPKGTVTWKQSPKKSVKASGVMLANQDVNWTDIKLASEYSLGDWKKMLSTAGAWKKVPVTFEYYLQAYFESDAAKEYKNGVTYKALSKAMESVSLTSTKKFSEVTNSSSNTSGSSTVLKFKWDGDKAIKLLTGEKTLSMNFTSNDMLPMYYSYRVDKVVVSWGKSKAVFDGKSKTWVSFSGDGLVDGSLSFTLDPSGINSSKNNPITETVSLRDITFSTEDTAIWDSMFNAASKIEVKFDLQRKWHESVASDAIESTAASCTLSDADIMDDMDFASGPCDCMTNYKTIPADKAKKIVRGKLKWTYTDYIVGHSATVDNYNVQLHFKIDGNHIGPYVADMQWVSFAADDTPDAPEATYTWTLTPKGTVKVSSLQLTNEPLKAQTIKLNGDESKWQTYLDSCASFAIKFNVRRAQLSNQEPEQGKGSISSASHTKIANLNITSNASISGRTGTPISVTKEQLMKIVTGDTTFDISQTVSGALDVIVNEYVDVEIITDRDTIHPKDLSSPQWVRWMQSASTEWFTDFNDVASHAFAELKDNAIYNETFEAMAGVPQTETLYFGSGGKEFMAKIAYEFVTGETATRKYHKTFTSQHCCANAIMNTYNTTRPGAQDSPDPGAPPTAVTYTCDGGNTPSTTGCSHSHTERWVAEKVCETRWNWSATATCSVASHMTDPGSPGTTNPETGALEGYVAPSFCGGATASDTKSTSDSATPGEPAHCECSCPCGQSAQSTVPQSKVGATRWNWQWRQVQGDCSVSDQINWSQDVQNLSYLKITELQIYQLSDAYVTGMSTITGGTDVIYSSATVNNYAFNVAQSNTASQGRLVYSYENQSLDDHTFPSCPSSNHPDSFKSDNVKQLEDAHHVTSTYTDITVVSDWAMLKTASGEMSLCYFDCTYKNTTVPLAIVDVNAGTVTADPVVLDDVSAQDAFYKNPLTTVGANIPKTGIGTVGYTGSYSSPYSKYNPSSSYPVNSLAGKVIAQGLYHSNSSAYASYNSASSFSGYGLWTGNIPIATISNGVYRPGRSVIAYTPVVHYGTSDWNWTPSYSDLLHKDVVEFTSVYKPGDIGINAILVHDPVSAQGAAIKSNTNVSDQRTTASTISNKALNVKCPCDASCIYSHLKSTDSACANHCDYTGELYCTDDCYDVIFCYNYMYDTTTEVTTSIAVPKYTRNCSEPHHSANTNYKYYISGMELDDGSFCDPMSTSFNSYTGKILLDSGMCLDASKKSEWYILEHDGRYDITQGLATDSEGHYYCTATGTYVTADRYSKATSYDHNFFDYDKRYSTNPCDHYATGDNTCWRACMDDTKHGGNQSFNTGSIITPSKSDTYVVLDDTLTLYFPSLGNFYGNGALGLPEVSSMPGKGFVDNMDTSKWTKRKYCIFKDLDVIYNGTYYYAGQMIELTPVNAVTYTVDIPIKNREYSNTEVSFYCVADNSPSDEWAENLYSSNFSRYNSNLAAYHDASKKLYFDVVGRIGVLTIVDTDDWRYSNLFKQSLDTWFINGIVRDVDISKQNKYVADSRDIMGRPITNDLMANRFSTSPWKLFSNLIPLPLTPLKNNISVLQNQPRRIGYPLYLTVDTVGEYYGENVNPANPIYRMQIRPHYYALNVKTQSWTPVDVYMRKGNTYAKIYSFNSTEDTTDYAYNEYLNFATNASRYNASTTSDIWQISKGIQDRYSVQLPMGDGYHIGTAQKLFLDERTRLFIGSDHSEGVDKGDPTVATDPATGFSYSMRDDNLINYQRHAQRWFLQLSLPSSAIFVPADSPPTDENIACVSNVDTCIVTALDIRVNGAVWCLKYSKPVDQDYIHVPGIASAISTIPVGDDIIVDISESNKSSALDMDSRGTH